ncbi:MAG: TetR/AcrR family transcriptional regulator, partial [Ilumatobacteraceae bacterium]
MTRLPTPRRRGRPRDDAASPAILQATLDEVAEVGLAGLTVEAVAARAGVGKATIYRRWSSKEALMLDAWVSCTPDKAVPHTGSLRGDLLALFSHVEAGLTTGMMQRIFPQMIAAAKVNPGVADAYRSFIAQRRRPLRTVLERAVDNGELPST